MYLMSLSHATMENTEGEDSFTDRNIHHENCKANIMTKRVLSHHKRELSILLSVMCLFLFFPSFPFTFLPANCLLLRPLTPQLHPICHSSMTSVLGLLGQLCADRTHILPNPLARASLLPRERINLRCMLVCLIVFVTHDHKSPFVLFDMHCIGCLHGSGLVKQTKGQRNRWMDRKSETCRKKKGRAAPERQCSLKGGCGGQRGRQ